MKTKTEDFFANRQQAPVLSNRAFKSVSQYRRSMLEQELEAGNFREPGVTKYADQSKSFQKTSFGNVISNQGLRKEANANWRGAGGTVRQTPEIYSPLWLNSNLNLPRDRATINAWSRAFFVMNPIVHNAILLHSTYPISKLNIKCKNEKVQDFFANMAEEIDLMNVCCQIAQEYWTIGEVFPYAELDNNAAKWSRILIQNPDYISVKHSVIAGEPIISLRPDENLKRIVTSNKASDIQQRQALDKGVIEHVRRGENIPLSNFYVSHIARKISPYEVRGTGLIVSSFRALMLFDKLRECKFAQSENMVNPLTLVKIGGESKPSAADIEAYRDVFENATADRDFKIFTHNEVTVERVGASGAILDTSNDITQLIKEIYIGLMVPSVLMDGGGDTTYANGGVALDVLRQRYMQFRNMLSAWLRRKIFAPISKINEFYDYVDGQKVLIVPDIDWNHMSLFDVDTYINTVSTLVQASPRKASVHTLYRSLGLDWEDEMRKIKDEQVHDMILMKENEALSKMPLSELRSIRSDDEIQEPIENPLPGEQSSEGGGMPGAEGGAPPGMPGMPPGPEGGPPPPPPGMPG